MDHWCHYWLSGAATRSVHHHIRNTPTMPGGRPLSALPCGLGALWPRRTTSLVVRPVGGKGPASGSLLSDWSISGRSHRSSGGETARTERLTLYSYQYVPRRFCVVCRQNHMHRWLFPSGARLWLTGHCRGCWKCRRNRTELENVRYRGLKILELKM